MDYPFSDQYMIYDYSTHRYTLTKAGVLDLIGINLDVRLNVAGIENQSAAADYALNQISRHLYAFIYSRCNGQNKNFIELTLAKYDECRELIKECMLNEVEYTLDNGTFWNNGGVNLSKSTALDINSLRGRNVVSYDTEMRLYQPLANGIKLLYQGVYKVPPFEIHEGY